MIPRRGERRWQLPSRPVPAGLTGLLVAALVGLMSVVLVLGAPAFAAFSGLNGTIAFGTDRGAAGDGEIFSVNPDGSSPTNLTNNPAEDAAPSWSADGSKIAFARDVGGASQIFVMNADGSGQTNLTNSPPGVINGQPHWSPDGTKIAFSSDRAAGNVDIWAMDANGANPTRLTTDPGADDQPAWSPDGTKVAFSRDGANIFVMNATGGSEMNLTGGVGLYNAQPAWSPDGTRIVFTSNRGAGDLNIWVMAANGATPTQLTTDLNLDDQPAFSSDGMRITFVSDRDGSFDVFTMNANGTGQTNLTSSATGFHDTEPNWQPIPADLAISIVDSPDPGTVGQQLTYSISVVNNGPATTPGVVVTNTLPTSVTFSSVAVSQGSCGAVVNQVLSCDLGSLGVGATATITVVVVPNSGGTLVDTATVAATLMADSNPANNTASASTTVNVIVMVNDVRVTEGNTGATNADFTVTLDAASNQSVTVVAQTANGTATAGSDYTAIGPTTLTFTPGVTTQTITVPVVGDTVNEPNETFVVTLTNPTNATIGKAQGVGTILDDDSPPSLSIDDVTLSEGNAGTTNVTFTVTLSGPSSQTVTVVAQTADGTATAGGDYTTIGPTTLTFPPGTTTQSVSVPIIGDTFPEPDETFSVNLTNPQNATIGKAQGVGTIKNDDASGDTVAIWIYDLSQPEGNSGTNAVTFTVELNRVSRAPVTVQYATADGSATVADGDYQATSGTLTFNSGELTKTLTVNVLGDTKVEPTEMFTVTLSNPQNAMISKAQAVGVIQNDDVGVATACSPRPAVTVASTATGDGRLQITLTAGTEGPNGANRLTELRFQGGTNALIDVAGQTGRTGAFTVALSDRPVNLTFFVRWATAGQTTTVPLVVVDTCGEWPTLVGGGAGAF